MSGTELAITPPDHAEIVGADAERLLLFTPTLAPTWSCSPCGSSHMPTARATLCVPTNVSAAAFSRASPRREPI